MSGRVPIDRCDAARLLGVSATADEATVRRAFRLWASMTHPDHGGSAERFAELRAARDLMLDPVPVPSPRTRPSGTSAERPEADATPPHPADQAIPLRPRKAWADVLSVPSPARVALLVAGAVLSVLAILVAVALPLPWGVVPAALASALWCVMASRAVLRRPDHGHVIVTRTLAWGPIVLAQLTLAAALGVAVIEVLPVLAVPFVAVIAAVNPAPGLWRGASR